jgi:hypothetical protein
LSEDNIDNTIPSTTEIVQKSQEAQAQQQSEQQNNTSPVATTTTTTASNPNKVVKSTIEWLSMEGCGACPKQEAFFNDTLKPQRDVPTEITKVDVKSDRGQQIADENKLKYVPFAEECLIFEDPNKKPECRKINKYDPSEWKIKLNSDSTTS